MLYIADVSHSDYDDYQPRQIVVDFEDEADLQAFIAEYDATMEPFAKLMDEWLGLAHRDQIARMSDEQRRTVAIKLSRRKDIERHVTVRDVYFDAEHMVYLLPTRKKGKPALHQWRELDFIPVETYIEEVHRQTMDGKNQRLGAIELTRTFHRGTI